MDMRVLVAAGLGGLLLLAGCGAEDEPGHAVDKDPGSPTYPAPLVTEDGALLVTCGGDTGFPVSLLPDGLPDVLTQDEAVEIFADLLSNPELAGELSLSFLRDGAEGTEWRVLRDDGDAYTLGLGHWTVDGPAKDAYVMYLQHHDDGWAMGGGGGCQLAPVLEGGNTWVELNEPSGGLDRVATEPTIAVNEVECTSSRDPKPYLHDPVVVENDASVTVYWTSDPMVGAATCPGNPRIEVPLPLSKPLGDRELLDGSTYPPVPVGEKVAG
jgi:hypothetical protein